MRCIGVQKILDRGDKVTLYTPPKTLDYQRIQRFYFMNLKNELMTIRGRRILYFMCEEQNSVFPNLE